MDIINQNTQFFIESLSKNTRYNLLNDLQKCNAFKGVSVAGLEELQDTNINNIVDTLLCGLIFQMFYKFALEVIEKTGTTDQNVIDDIMNTILGDQYDT